MTAPRPRFDIVCFDFDSTLTRLEGIDELARRAGVEAEIAPLTAAAMDGTIALDEVYGRRLDIVRPDSTAIAWLADRYLQEIVPGVPETLAALQEAKCELHIVSGGIRGAILAFATKFGVAADNVHAVDVHFDAEGKFKNFDRYSPLATPSGKAAVVKQLSARHGAIALVGDGITDVAARAAGAYVIGFGGVVARDGVRSGADAFVLGPSLVDTLELLLVNGAVDDTEAHPHEH